MGYIGRFAPSPTGPLHLGSLVTAAASFLAARQQDGRWLVRIEDIDPPREAPGAADEILRALERFELHWDGEVLYQSTRMGAYRAIAEALLKRRVAYRCDCSRATLRRLRKGHSTDARYPGLCREKNLSAAETAIRLCAPREPIRFHDMLQGHCSHDVAAETGDYVIFRRDALPAYHLAVVHDDASQGVTDVVRGVDLLDSTPLHIHLQRTLGLATPRYGHLPIVVDARAQKLSKQTGAVPVDSKIASAVAIDVLRYLGLEPPQELRGAKPGTLWAWAVGNWRIEGLACQRQIVERDADMAEARAID